MADLKIEKIIASFVALLVGVSLVEPIYTTSADANITGVGATLLALAPTFFVIGIIVVGYRSMIGK